MHLQRIGTFQTQQEADKASDLSRLFSGSQIRLKKSLDSYIDPDTGLLHDRVTVPDQVLEAFQKQYKDCEPPEQVLSGIAGLIPAVHGTAAAA